MAQKGLFCCDDYRNKVCEYELDLTGLAQNKYGHNFSGSVEGRMCSLAE
jgi:hypothetical protein